MYEAKLTVRASQRERRRRSPRVTGARVRRQDCWTCGSTFDLPDAKAWNFSTLYKTIAETNNKVHIHEDRDETRNCQMESQHKIFRNSRKSEFR
jgi:hypothetical protein